MRLQLRLGRAHKGQSDDGLDAGHGGSWEGERRESRGLIAAQTSQAGRTSGEVYGGFGVGVWMYVCMYAACLPRASTARGWLGWR
jgi:hypothetical protein